jgi:hypothetical protein
MQCHTEESNGFFNCQSYFQQEICPLADPVPESVKIQKKNEYLPGEKLLIKLNKEKRKKKDNIDIARITESLKRILPL